MINLGEIQSGGGSKPFCWIITRRSERDADPSNADVVMLTTLPEQFSAPWLANLQFYEPRTIHDSSLSKAIHGIVAARCGLLTQSYQFWRGGPKSILVLDPHSCDDGIHAAATGAIWLGAIQGFAGVSVRDGEFTSQSGVT